jgi:hypothetical protein
MWWDRFLIKHIDSWTLNRIREWIYKNANNPANFERLRLIEAELKFRSFVCK